MGSDYAIVGGGIVGLSVAYGLLNLGETVTIFDEGDLAFRASRGNFGLVWVQGKGMKQPAYAKWSRNSAALWKGYAQELEEATGQTLSLQQDGGYGYHLTEESLEQEIKDYTWLKEQLGGDYPFEVLRLNELKKEEPNVGTNFAGAVYHPEDGHVNSLQLFRALAKEVRRKGAKLVTSVTIQKVETAASGFRLTDDSGKVYESEKLVLSAGLGSMKLGPLLGFKAPIRPQRGQVMITEKIPKLMNRPSDTLRQVNEGGVQIGASAEEVDLDDRETPATLAKLAREAIQIFPDLAHVKTVRSWSALRIMSPDGLPIYQESLTCPGAFLVTCHSGITLSAAHARLLPLWMEGSHTAPELDPFGEDRFNV